MSRFLTSSVSSEMQSPSKASALSGLGIAAIVALIFVGLWQIRPVLFDQSTQRRDQVLFALLAAGIGFLSTMIFFRIVSWPTNVWYSAHADCRRRCD